MKSDISRSAVSSTAPVEIRGLVDYEELACRCGKLKTFTSKSKDNPGRRFFRCPIWEDTERTCDFFYWQDEMHRILRQMKVKGYGAAKLDDAVNTQVSVDNDVVNTQVSVDNVAVKNDEMKKNMKLRKKLGYERMKTQFWMRGFFMSMGVVLGFGLFCSMKCTCG